MERAMSYHVEPIPRSLMAGFAAADDPPRNRE